MTVDSLFVGGLILSLLVGGMLLGAWFASRGFKKALLRLNKDIEEGKWDE